MSDVPETRPRVEGSLYEAAHALSQAADARQPTNDPLRRCALGLEFRLDTLAQELGRPGGIDPRLVHVARAIEERMRDLLLRCWSLSRRFAEQSEVGEWELRTFAHDLERAARDEIDLFFEELRATGGAD